MLALSLPSPLSSSNILKFVLDNWFTIPCLLTSIYLTLRYIQSLYLRRYLRINAQKSSQVHPPPVIPPAIPYVGHFISNAISYQGYMNTLARRYPRCSALTLPMMSSKHHVIIAPSLVHQVLTLPKVTSKFSGEPFFFGLMEKVFGDSGQLFRHMDQKILWGPVSKSVQGMMRESFLKPALQTLNEGVSERASRLVSFRDGPDEKEPWERAANTHLIDGNTAVTASLHPLLRDFVGQLAIEILLGPDFLENFPNTLPELFALDGTFSLLLSGLPQAFVPALRPGLTARSRLLEALRQHHVALIRSVQGKDPGFKWSRVGETSNVMSERIKAFADAGDFDESKSPEERGKLSAIGNLVVLWALNVNANQVTFWMIFHIYSNPNLLDQIRKEIEPYISIAGSKEEVKARETLHIDLPGLQKDCPLLLGSFLETMRWESGATVYRYIYQDFTLTESSEDARIFGHEVPQTFLFREGEYIVVPNGTHQSDERYFLRSNQFDAKRFWVQSESEVKQPFEADIEDDQAMEGNWRRGERARGEKGIDQQADNEQIKVDYKTMHPWGGGPTVCKGKKFAEGEVLSFVAAIVACWDMVRVDQYGKEVVGWGTHPGHKDGTGAVVPTDDVFVKLNRRKVA